MVFFSRNIRASRRSIVKLQHYVGHLERLSLKQLWRQQLDWMQNPTCQPRFEYERAGIKLKETEEEKDLGVLVESSLKPALQCKNAAKKANQRLGLIRRCFCYRTKASFVPFFFKTFGPPKLEFSVAAWGPWLVKNVDVINLYKSDWIVCWREREQGWT